MIKRTPNINNEANIPVFVDNPSAPGDDTAVPEPAETWSRGGRLRAKLSTIHTLEADDPISKISSRPESTPTEQGEETQAVTNRQVSKPAEEGRALPTNQSSWKVVTVG